MTETTIYVTGSIGFKSALVKKLARRHTMRDISPAIISLALTETSTLDDLKDSIGAEFLSEHNIFFFYEMPSNHPSFTRLVTPGSWNSR